MKFSTIVGALSMASGIMAAPASADASVEKRQSQATKMTATNTQMWSLSLSGFLSNRNNKSPSYLIWTSDGCTSSPDKPNGWNFVNACYRHDFGYRNYKDQQRFTDSNKARIDDKFLTDLLTVCTQHGAGAVCRTLANTYYNTMKLFTKRDAEDLYELVAKIEAMSPEEYAAYEAELEAAESA